MEKSKILKSNQEQIIAAYDNKLLYERLNERSRQLLIQDENNTNAIKQIELLKEFISHPEHILGNPDSKQGEIAEHTQVRFSNAENMIVGKEPQYSFDGVGRTAMEDYLYNGKMVQSKYYNSPATTFDSILKHLKTYPDFFKKDGTYDIPPEQFDQLVDIYNRGESNRSSLHKTEFGNEETIYKKIKEFEKNNNVKFEDVIHPSKAKKSEVQLYTIDETVKKEESKIAETNEQEKQRIKKETAPTLKQGVKVTAISAASEGGITFAIEFFKKKSERKKISNFTDEDWIEIFKSSGIGTIKGGIRGASLYAITNFSTTPAPIANALISATYGILGQSYFLAKGQISESEFIDNSELLCLDISVSTLSSVLGEMIIPIPIIGTVIGNTVGMYMEQIAVSYLQERETKLINQYEEEVTLRVESIKETYKKQLMKIETYFNYYVTLLELAFDENANNQFKNSIKLAEFVGVQENKILKSEEDGESFFNSTDAVSL